MVLGHVAIVQLSSWFAQNGCLGGGGAWKQAIASLRAIVMLPMPARDKIQGGIPL